MYMCGSIFAGVGSLAGYISKNTMAFSRELKDKGDLYTRNQPIEGQASINRLWDGGRQ